MEKRTIIAFALSFLVLLLWSFFFAPRQEQRPGKTVADREHVPAADESKKAPSEKPGLPETSRVKVEQAGLPGPGEEEEVIVETPLFKAVLSSAGPTIKSYQLKKYRKNVAPDSPPVELINTMKDQEDFLQVSFEPAFKTNKNKTISRVDKKEVRLGPGSQPEDLVFAAGSEEGYSVEHVFRIYPDKYPMDLIVTFRNHSEKTLEGNVRAVLRNLPPPKDRRNSYGFLGLALLLNGKLESREANSDELKKGETLSGRIGWIAYEENYFMAGLLPEEQGDAKFSGRLLPSGLLEAAYLQAGNQMRPRSQLSSRFTLYLGPRDLGVLKEIGRDFDAAVDFGWFDFVAKPLLYTLNFFNRYAGNYGVSIIILTVLIKILFWPLTHKSYRSMKEMQKIQPLMAKIRERYKDNKEQMNKEMMSLYRTYKVNPMGGCLPMLIQLPVFFALYRILCDSIELRHAPFALWINDLSAPDRLFRFPFEIPFMSPPFGIPVLTLIMGATMFIQQKMTPTPGDPTQAKVMLLMPVIFTAMFINFPSGLVLYWLVNNVLSIGQQYRIIRKSA